jgi:hypothetical protein
LKLVEAVVETLGAASRGWNEGVALTLNYEEPQQRRVSMALREQAGKKQKDAGERRLGVWSHAQGRCDTSEVAMMAVEKRVRKGQNGVKRNQGEEGKFWGATTDKERKL